MLFFWTGWGCWSIFAWHGWSAFPFFFLVLIGGLLIGIAITKSRQPTIPPKTTESSAAEETSTTEEKAPPPKPSSVHRSRDHRVIGGICGGLGEYFNIDPTIVRILWVLVGLGSAGGAVLVYVILMFIIPEEP
ncbi:PspC domain-containing protein [bacterium]|nr:PspC domain-containing protein [bacterium]MBU1652656.1 PspC domain-containing protein [bacterium]